MAGQAFGDVGVSLCFAGARNAVIFSTKCVPEARKVPSANGRVRDDEFMVGSWSDRPRNVNDVASVFSRFLFDFGALFCWVGAVFVEVGG